MKICSLYGAGFYYVPGTDMCIKIGGWVRAEIGVLSNGSLTWGPFNNNVNNRTTNNTVFRARGYITADAREQTAYGTVRGYIAVGVSENDTGFNTPANTFSSNRAFIQWAGFTFGRAQSFFDFYSVPATSYWGTFPASDTGDPGWLTFGYTAQFGNGWSATVSAEERRMTQIVNTNTVNLAVAPGGVAGVGTVLPGGFTTAVPGVTANAGAYGGFNVPDIVGNIRVDQAWGAAQVMGALHEVNATYYGGAPTPGTPALDVGPSTKWGFATGAGIKLNAPMIGHGDYLQAQVNYAQGASRYVFMTPNTNWGYVDGTNSAAFGILSDAVYGSTLAGTGSDLELTTAWGVNAAYEHFWNPAWRTSVYGGYAAVSYNDNANDLLTAGVTGINARALGFDMDWSTAWVGTRTQWNVNKNFYLGVDVLYQKLMTANVPGGAIPNAAAYGSLRGATLSDQDNWSFRFRAHRDFYP